MRLDLGLSLLIRTFSNEVEVENLSGQAWPLIGKGVENLSGQAWPCRSAPFFFTARHGLQFSQAWPCRALPLFYGEARPQIEPGMALPG